MLVSPLDLYCTMCYLIKNQCYIHIRAFNNLFVKVFQYFVGLYDSANIFISSENIFVKNCVSHYLQQSLEQILHE